MREIKLLALCGSLREGSNTAAVLRTIACELLPPKVSLRTHPLHALALYDSDLDQGDPPPAVKALRQAIREAEGVVIASPEISHGMSGVLKNALDWLSSHASHHPLKGKPVMPLCSSPFGTGGARAQLQLTETLWAIEATPVSYPPVVVTHLGAKISEGRLTHEATRQSLAHGILALEAMIRQAHVARLPLVWA